MITADEPTDLAPGAVKMCFRHFKRIIDPRGGTNYLTDLLIPVRSVVIFRVRV